MTRRPMYQTSAPFVEMEINGYDILRSKSGKPRTLLSFSHDIFAGTGGFWTLEVFDPDYIGLEGLLVSTAVDVSESESTDTTTDDGKEQSHVNISLAKFRYGYVGHSENEVVSSLSPSFQEYFWGTVHAYVPRYETNGTYLTIRGDSAGARIAQVPMVYNSFPNMSVYQIFKFVCEQHEWDLTPIGQESLEELEAKLDALPRDFLVPDGGALDTEALQVQHRKRENEDALDFLNRLCGYVRTAGPDYNNFICRLECRIAGDGTPIRRLYFGAETFAQGPVREYTYMRDPKSDVIAFAPNVQVYVATLTGAAGMTYKMDDLRKGEMEIYTLDEVNREMHKFKDMRSRIAFTHSEFGALQRGFVDSDGDKAEGHASGSGSAANPIATRQDDQGMEMTVPITDSYKGDEQVVQYWLSMQSFINRATLEVFGDPDEAIQPGRTIVVYVYVPVSDEQMRIHWTTTLWTITGVNHEIRGGEMRTRMELTRLGWDRGGVLTKSAVSSYNEQASEGKQKDTGG